MASSQRYRALDVLRGLAIIGTLGTNIWIFSHPYGFLGYFSAPTVPGAPAGWAAVQSVLQQLAQGKFLGLLTLMFGIGLEIQRRSAIRKGRRWPGRYPWRAGLLFLDGVLHYLLVVEFDVLMGYAVTGAVVAYLLITSERAQRVWMIATAALHLLAMTALTALLLIDDNEGGSVGGSYPPSATNPYAADSWLDLIALRIDNLLLFRLEPLLIFAYSIFMFLLGSRLFRAGVLEGRGRLLRHRLMIIGGLGFAADFALQVFGGGAGVLLGRYTTAALVSLGLLALITELVARSSESGWLSTRCEQIGRMALSSYVLQNVIASTLCYGWGLGLATRMSDGWRVPGTMLIFVGTVALIALFARIWLSRFSRGPVESAWSWCFEKINSVLGPERPATAEPERDQLRV